MFGNLSKPMLKSAAGETPVGLPVGRESRRARWRWRRVCRGRVGCSAHADEERDAARFEEWVRAGRAEQCATWSGRNWRRRARRRGCCGQGLRFHFRGAVGAGLPGELQQPAAAFDRAGSRGSRVDCALRMDRPHGDGQSGRKRHKAA